MIHDAVRLYSKDWFCVLQQEGPFPARRSSPHHRSRMASTQETNGLNKRITVVTLEVTTGNICATTVLFQKDGFACW